VSDPGRYLVVHEAAEALLDELSYGYMVERRESKEPLGDGPLVRCVRLIPWTPAAAPLSVVFTDFPSVVLGLGRWYRRSFPACGCDTCDEQPAELVADLRRRAEAVVEGGLWERARRGLAGSWAETRLIGTDVDCRQRLPLDAREARAARREGFAAAVQWGPWPRRSRGGRGGAKTVVGH